MVEQLPHLDPITRLSPRVIRILGGNPSKFTLQGTNTYLIGTGPKRILLDTGEGKAAWKESLQKVLKDEGCTVKEVVLSHWHADHVGGVADVKGVVGGDMRVLKHKPDASQEGFEDGAGFETEGATLKALYSPGHTNDHMSFLLAEEKAMFTADNVLGHGTAVFEDLGAYMKSLDLMKAAPGFEGRAYPGHGEVIEDGRGKIGEYIAHRKQREEEILSCMEGGEEWESMQIVKVVYKVYPENLHVPAEGGVKQVLRKLEVDGRVSEEGGKWKIVGGGRAAL